MQPAVRVLHAGGGPSRGCTATKSSRTRRSSAIVAPPHPRACAACVSPAGSRSCDATSIAWSRDCGRTGHRGYRAFHQRLAARGAVTAAGRGRIAARQRLARYPARGPVRGHRAPARPRPGARGIEAAIAAACAAVKLNCVVMRDKNDDEIAAFAELTRIAPRIRALHRSHAGP